MPGVLSITQQGMFIVFSFNSGQYVRFFQPDSVQGGINNDTFYLHTITPRQSISGAEWYATELQFQIQAPQTAIQVAQDFAAVCLQARRVSLGLTATPP